MQMAKCFNQHWRKIIVCLIILALLCPGYSYWAKGQALVSKELINLTLDKTFSLAPVKFTKRIADLALMRGVEIDYKDPLKIKFYFDLKNQATIANKDSQRIIRYFLGFLSLPQDKLWVNLSPYEPERIMPEELANLDIGKDMLWQDYLLKQLTSQVSDPKTRIGKKFWHKVKEIIKSEAKTDKLEIDLLNKIWIVPDIAQVYEKLQTSDSKSWAFWVNKARLKVLIEEDYLAPSVQRLAYRKEKSPLYARRYTLNAKIKELFKQELLPLIEQEINTSQDFAILRQLYYSLILANYFKRVLGQVYLYRDYINQGKTIPISFKDNSQIRTNIYRAYVSGLKRGIYDSLQKEYDPKTKRNFNRRYFSGGLGLATINQATTASQNNLEPMPKQLVELTAQIKPEINSPLTQQSLERVKKNQELPWSDEQINQTQENLKLLTILGSNIVRMDKFPNSNLILVKDKDHAYKIFDEETRTVIDIPRPEGDKKIVDITFLPNSKVVLILDVGIEKSCAGPGQSENSDETRQSSSEIDIKFEYSCRVFNFMTKNSFSIPVDKHKNQNKEKLEQSCRREEIKTFEDFLTSFSLSKDNRFLCVNYQHYDHIYIDGDIKLFDLEHNCDLEDIIGVGIASVAFSKDNRLMYISYMDSTLRIFEIKPDKSVITEVKPEIISQYAFGQVVFLKDKNSQERLVLIRNRGLTKIERLEESKQLKPSFTMFASEPRQVMDIDIKNPEVSKAFCDSDLHQIFIIDKLKRLVLVKHKNITVFDYEKESFYVLNLDRPAMDMELINDSVIAFYQNNQFNQPEKTFLFDVENYQLQEMPYTNKLWLSPRNDVVGRKIKHKDNVSFDIFDLATQRTIPQLSGQMRNTRDILFSPNGRFIILKVAVGGELEAKPASRCGEVCKYRIFDNQEKNFLTEIWGQDTEEIEISSNSRWLITMSSSKKNVFDLEEKKELDLGKDIKLYNAKFSSDSKYLYYIDMQEMKTQLLNLETRQLCPIELGEAGANAEFSDDNKYLYVHYMGGLIKVFDLESLFKDPLYQGNLGKDSLAWQLQSEIISLLINAGIINNPLEFKNHYDLLKPIAIKLAELTSKFNRFRFLEILRSSEIFKFLQTNKADIYQHFEFWLELIEKNKRTAILVLEGILAATKNGLIGIDLNTQEKDKILGFINLTNGFNLDLYNFYNKEGLAALNDLLKWSDKMLDDSITTEEIEPVINNLNSRGYKGPNLMLAVNQKAIPASGTSFIKQENIQALRRDYSDAGDLREHIPSTLRNRIFSPGKLERIEWGLKKQEKDNFDPHGEVSRIINKLRYPDNGKEEQAKKKDAQADRQKFIVELKRFFSLITTELPEKKNILQDKGLIAQILDSFLAYACHNDLLKEKLENIQIDEYFSLEILRELFVDKDKLSILIREVLEKEFKPDGTEVIRNEEMFASSLIAIWNKTDKEYLINKLEKRIGATSSSQIRAKIIPILLKEVEKDPGLMGLVSTLETLLGQRMSLPIAVNQFIEVLFSQPYSAITQEITKFEAQVIDATKLSFRVVKGPYYGLWGTNAGVCIASDMKLWKKKEFLLLAIIDENRKEAVGFINLFIHEEDGKRYLTVPGINPSTEFISGAKSEKIFSLIEKALIEITITEGFDAVVIPTEKEKEGAITSNRLGITELVAKRHDSQAYKEIEFKNPVVWNTMPNDYSFKSVYVLYENKIKNSYYNLKIDQNKSISILRPYDGVSLAPVEGQEDVYLVFAPDNLAFYDAKRQLVPGPIYKKLILGPEGYVLKDIQLTNLKGGIDFNLQFLSQYPESVHYSSNNRLKGFSFVLTSLKKRKNIFLTNQTVA